MYIHVFLGIKFGGWGYVISFNLLKFYFLNQLYTASQTERSFLFDLSKVTGGE